jgi:hypothetical protein
MVPGIDGTGLAPMAKSGNMNRANQTRARPAFARHPANSYVKHTHVDAREVCSTERHLDPLASTMPSPHSAVRGIIRRVAMACLAEQTP